MLRINRILECGLEAEANYVVSGDKHLLQLGDFNRSPIVKVAEFLRLLRAG